MLLRGCFMCYGCVFIRVSWLFDFPVKRQKPWRQTLALEPQQLSVAQPSEGRVHVIVSYLDEEHCTKGNTLISTTGYPIFCTTSCRGMWHAFCFFLYLSFLLLGLFFFVLENYWITSDYTFGYRKITIDKGPPPQQKSKWPDRST